MSRTTACIMRINEQLDRISGLDGPVADMLENEERRIDKMVDMVLKACDDDNPQFFTVFDNRDYQSLNLDANTRWIPCSERLPESAGVAVIVSAKNRYDQNAVFIAFQGYGDFKWHTMTSGYMNHEHGTEISDAWTITHWMPLPEPPEKCADS